MSLLITNKLPGCAFTAGSGQTPWKMFSRVVRAITRLLVPALVQKGSEQSWMVNGSAIKLPVNPRSWKRNSALLVHSKYQERN